MKQELTPWFPASVKPVRPGVYEVTRMLYSHAKRQDVRHYHKLEFSRGHWRYTKRSHVSYPGSLSSFGVFPHEGEFWRGLTGESNGR